MAFPVSINWTNPFPILGLLGTIFLIFIQILKENSVSKQWRPWSDAALCGVWSGFALLADVQKKKDARLIWISMYEQDKFHALLNLSWALKMFYDPRARIWNTIPNKK